MGPRTHLDGCGKSRRRRDSITENKWAKIFTKTSGRVQRGDCVVSVNLL